MKNFGLLGKDISYSFSPILHEIIFKEFNLTATYKIYDTPNIANKKQLLLLLKTNNLLGLNVTIPYKTKILNLIDDASSEAKNIGATNCLKFSNNKITAFNTDYFGILETFKKMKLNLENKIVVILGSGGATKSIVQVLKEQKSIIYIVSRDIKKIKNNFKNITIISYDDLNNISGYLLINATPVGTYPQTDISPVEKNVIKNFDYIFDLIYNPKKTLFLKYAKLYNKKYENGLYMLVVQAIKSQEIWNNINLNYEKIYNNFLSQIYK